MTSHPFVELRQDFSGVRVALFSFLCSVLQIIVCPLSFFFWPLFLRFTDYDYPFRIFKLLYKTLDFSGFPNCRNQNSNDTDVVPNHSKSAFFLGAFSAYRQRKMVLTSKFWFKVEYCFTIVFYENVDIKFSAHDVFLE